MKKLFSHPAHAGALALVIVAWVLIFNSSRQLALTIDEADHLYCGMEWLQYQTFTAWPENPPLARSFAALGPYLDGYRIDKPLDTSPTLFDHFIASYNQDYYALGPIRTQLLYNRILMSLFFLLAAWVVWRWTQSLAGPYAAFIAVGIFVTLPPILAHSSVGTTDIAFTSTFLLMLWTFTRWMKNPRTGQAIALGICTAVSLVTKFSVLIFFPVCAITLLIFWLLMGIRDSSWTIRTWLISALKSGVWTMLVAFIAWWGFFGFSSGPLGDEPVIRIGIKDGSFPESLSHVWVLAPEWFAGLQLLLRHHENGAIVLVNETLVSKGVGYFYALVTFLKTPLPFLFLWIGGVIAVVLHRSRKLWESTALVCLPLVIILVLGIVSNINYGIRHILIIYPLGAIGASALVIKVLENFNLSEKIRKAVPALLVAWQLCIVLIISPHFLSYFNIMGGKEPGQYVNDSDLDWGQGLFELSDFCKEQHIDTLWLAYQGLNRDCWYDLPVARLLPPDTVVHGWVAVSEMHYRGVFQPVSIPMENCQWFIFTFEPTEDFTLHQRYRWLDRYPLAARVGGGSIRLYHVP